MGCGESNRLNAKAWRRLSEKIEDGSEKERWLRSLAKVQFFFTELDRSVK